MSEQPSNGSDHLVSTETKITAVFILAALASVLAATTVTDSQRVHVAVLLGVGVIAPTLISEWRD